METSFLQLVGCPDCAAPAEITDRFVLESTDGPVEHVKVSCARRHRFTLPAERLSGAAPRKEPVRWTPTPMSS